MASGGKREGAGRKPGAPNKASAAREAKLAAGGELPLEYMLKVMRDDTKSAEVRMDMAKAAAPYVHPRLSAAEIKQETTHRYVARIPEKAANYDTWYQLHSTELPKQHH